MTPLWLLCVTDCKGPCYLAAWLQSLPEPPPSSEFSVANSPSVWLSQAEEGCIRKVSGSPDGGGWAQKTGRSQRVLWPTSPPGHTLGDEAAGTAVQTLATTSVPGQKLGLRQHPGLTPCAAKILGEQCSWLQSPSLMPTSWLPVSSGLF